MMARDDTPEVDTSEVDTPDADGPDTNVPTPEGSTPPVDAHRSGLEVPDTDGATTEVAEPAAADLELADTESADTTEPDHPEPALDDATDLTAAEPADPAPVTPDVPVPAEPQEPQTDATVQAEDAATPADPPEPEPIETGSVETGSVETGSVETGPVESPAEPGPTDAVAGPTPRPAIARSWRTLRRAIAPRATRPQAVVGLLCVLLGFALMVQVQANRDEGLSSLRQDELVRILDEVTQRHDELEQQAFALRAQRAELVTGTDTERAAQEAALERARVQGILAGQLPVEGPGVRLTITAPVEPISALVLYNVLEELRNAGAEAVQLNDTRLTASSYIVDVAGGVVVDGQSVTPPYRWLAIGEPDTIIPALNMPGGAMSSVRNATGETRLEAREHVAITATKPALAPRWATPAPEEP